MTRFRIGKLLGAGEGAHREFGNDRPARFHLSEDLFVLLGINHVNPTTQHADRRAGERTQRTFMRAGINAAREPADDYQTSVS